MHVLQINKHTLLPLIKPYLPINPVIVEAGAFNGRDTKALTIFWPLATIYAFEPVPEIFAMLVENTKMIPTVHRYQYALSDNNGTATFYVAESPKKPGQPYQAGSLLKPKERLKLSDIEYKKTTEVQTITLDTWATQFHIDRIDFLWLDMQGYELNVLKAAPHVLKQVTVIYTEVEFVQAYEGQYLYKEVKEWLEHEGFTMIARDFPETPTWFFGNALFVRK